MKAIIFGLLTACALTSCSGTARVGYILEGEWDYEGWKHSKNSDDKVACVIITGDGTYTVDKGGCIS